MSVPTWVIERMKVEMEQSGTPMETIRQAYEAKLEKYVLAVAPGYLAMYADPDYYRPKVEDIVEYSEALMREVLERSKP